MMISNIQGRRQIGVTPSIIARYRSYKLNQICNLIIVVTMLIFVYLMGRSREYIHEKREKTVRRVGDESKSSSASMEESDGWHPIYVYHGKKWIEGKKRKRRKFPKGSQAKQDKIVLALTSGEMGSSFSKGGSQNNRYFVDLAANDAELLSNSLLLERNGWEGLCIEPNPVYWYYLAHRRCAVAAAFVGGVEDTVPVDVHLGDGIYNGAFGGIVHNEMDNKNNNPQLSTERRYTVSLQTVFHKFHVPSVIDYLSLDVEGAEYLVMKDFPFTKYQVNIMTIERPKQELRTLLTENSLVFVMNLTTWGETLWVHNSLLTTGGMTVDLIKGVVSKVCGISCY